MRDLFRFITQGHQTPPADPFDPWLPILAIGLAAFGWVMISSASVANPLGMYYFSLRHGIFLLLALGLAASALYLPSRFWRQYAWPALALGGGLLILVLLVGDEINGSRRWIALPGPLPTVQPSEVAKLGLLLYMAHFMAKHQTDLRHNMLSIWRPTVVMVPLFGLLFLGRDFGSAAIYTAAVSGMLFISGTSWRGIGLAAGLLGSLIVTMIIVEPYRMLRLVSYSNPWADPFNTGYQLSQSLIGFGRGGIDGVGLGNGIQKLGYLPEAHNDFIFATIGEELGILGPLVLLFAFFLLGLRILIIARTAEHHHSAFAAYFAYGVGFTVLSQAGINIGVATGVLPTKGLTLPLISYGGSSLVITLVMLAIVMRIDIETRQQMIYRARRDAAERRWAQRYAKRRAVATDS